MQKDFDTWNTRQKEIDAKEKRLYFHVGEIWWVHLGENIGYEMNGKSSQYLRPVIILKKYNYLSFLGVPLSTSGIKNKYRMFVGKILEKDASANLSQLRNLDSKRLAHKICTLDQELFNQVKKKASEVNFN